MAARCEHGGMAQGYVPTSHRAAYTTAQIRMLFGRSTAEGSIVPLHANTVARWRKSGRIPHMKLNSRNFRYPREEIDALLHARHGDPRGEDEYDDVTAVYIPSEMV
jgi:hypothetical protein